jgi:excisionase family DNA binding protein
MEHQGIRISKLVNAKDLEGILGIHHKTILRFARLGVLPTVRFGRLVRFNLEQIEDWVRAGGDLRQRNNGAVPE